LTCQGFSLLLIASDQPSNRLASQTLCEALDPVDKRLQQ